MKKKGNIPWNKGLTKNDDRIRKSIDKKKETMRHNRIYFPFFIACKCGCGEGLLDRGRSGQFRVYKKEHYDRSKAFKGNKLRLGINSWNLGMKGDPRVKRSIESRIKQSNTTKGHYVSKETGRKISLAKKNKKISKKEIELRISYKIKKYEDELIKKDKIIKQLMNDELINGVLLSDGGLAKPKSNTSLSQLRVTQKTENIEFLNKIQTYLNDLGYDTKTYNSLHKKQKRYFTTLITQNKIEWKELRKLWYPNGIKVVPEFVKLTPKTIAWWFMGDGSCSWKNKEKTSCSIELCTESFSLENIEYLKLQLKEVGINNISIRCLKNKNYEGQEQFRIAIYQKEEIIKFFDIIEPYILSIFRYKIKRPNICKKLTTKVEK